MKKVIWFWLGVVVLFLLLLVFHYFGPILGIERSGLEWIERWFAGLVFLFLVLAFGMDLILQDEGYPTELSEEGIYEVLASRIEGDMWYFLVRKTATPKGKVITEGKVIARFAPSDFVYDQTNGQRPGDIRVVAQGTYKKAILYSNEQEEAGPSEVEKERVRMN